MMTLQKYPAICLVFGVLVLGAAQAGFGQVPAPVFRPSTGVAAPPPFRFRGSANVHNNWAEAVSDIPEAVSHHASVAAYWRRLADFAATVNTEYAQLQAEANRRRAIVCRDYQAVVVGSPGEVPDSITLRPAPPRGPVLVAAKGSYVDVNTPRGRELERQWLYRTRIGQRAFCSIPSIATPTLPVMPNTSTFTPTWGALTGGYSLMRPPVYSGPSLMSGASTAFSAPRYSLGVDLSSLSRNARAWQSSMEARYPSLRSR